ncbi:MAG: class II fumarate hydratase, partial [Desulfomonilaceae bacterium]
VFLLKGTKPNLKQINRIVEKSPMLVTGLSPVIGYDKTSEIARHAVNRDLTPKSAALELGYIKLDYCDRSMDPIKMVHPFVADRQTIY